MVGAEKVMFGGSQATLAADGIHRRMRVDPDRVFYCGDLGQPAMRRSGSLMAQVSLGAPIRIRFGAGAWQQGHCLVIQPYERHSLFCETRKVCNLLIEPETVDPAQLPAFLRDGNGVVDAPDFIGRMRAVAFGAPLTPAGLDIDLLGRPLAQRIMDPRIGAVVALIQSSPNLPDDAGALAQRVGLSTSRFLHLFKTETGVSYRRLRAWKRARMLLPSINRPHNLAKLAQDIGYPDSTHFSHSIREYFGISPKDILRGCRRIQILGPPGREARAAGAALAWG